MSTSLAVQPAFRTSKTLRTKANPDRTIFGTTLDNYGRCFKLLKDPKAVKEATELHQSKSSWQPRSGSSQRMVDVAWGLRDHNKPDIGEEFSTGFSRIWENKLNRIEEDCETVSEIASRSSSRNFFPSSFAKNRDCKSAFVRRKLEKPSPPRLLSANSTFAPLKTSTHTPGKSASMATPGKRPVGGGNKITVPRFRLSPNAVNPMRIGSLKITETGAKDLINAQNINKIGLGDTLQYNYQEFQRQKTPQFYKDHGHVLLLGQRFTDDTTNKDVTAPGGFYQLGTPDRNINEKHRHVVDRNDEATIVRRSYENKPSEEQLYFEDDDYDITKEHIPLNIRHKFGDDNVTKVLKQNKDEVIQALTRESDLKHSGMVPARRDVKELNHPIDPSPAHFTTFGDNLKYDKFEGGLHLYIK
ncbi:uncharacterized protein LOC143463101 [Clavelina lepadiformis]|uniref:uncharacterized protein LOC143463101 n=1 Tax=Clavelina lepadiformis TaxID=159417 RepID=UPI004041E73D